MKIIWCRKTRETAELLKSEANEYPELDFVAVNLGRSDWMGEILSLADYIGQAVKVKIEKFKKE